MAAFFWGVGVLVVSAALGLLLGGLYLLVSDSVAGPEEGFEGLGRLLLAIFLGFLASGVSLFLLVFFMSRCLFFGSDRRGVLLLILVPLLVLCLGFATVSLGLGVLPLVSALLLFLLVPLVWALVAAGVRPRVVLLGLAVLLVLALLVYGVLVVQERAQARAVLDGISWGVPALVDSPARAWERDPSSTVRVGSQDSWTLFPSSGGYLRYLSTSHGTVFVLSLGAMPQCIDAPTYRCVEVDGVYRFTSQQPWNERMVSVVASPKGAWAISHKGDVRLPEEVLASLREVSPEEFSSLTGTRFSR